MITVTKPPTLEVPLQSPNTASIDFNLDILVVPIQGNTIRADNTYTTACNCTSTTSCIDDDDERRPRSPHQPTRCPDSD